MAKFDDLDMKIIAELIKDASISIPRLSNRINVNSSVVYSRIKRLVKRGLIERYTLEVDEGLLGFPIKAMIGCNIDSRMREKIVNEIQDLDETRQILEVTGRFDLLLSVRTRSLDYLHTFISDSIGRVEGVRHTETFIEMKRRTKIPNFIPTQATKGT